MQIEVIKPLTKELIKYIECFYIVKNSRKNIKTTYFTFPSIHSIVSISSNIEIRRTNKSIKVIESSKQNFISELDVKFMNPILVQYEGDIKEITIYFKPLGLNRFLNKSLKYYSNESQFIPFSDYIDTMQFILRIKSRNEMIEQLESYWLNKLKTDVSFKLEPALKSIIANPNSSISSIANKNNLSHKTLISHFKKDICKTPSQFRKIVRFRNALKNEEDNLTQLSYATDYFDQAHMIKDFYKLTGYNPKLFFKNLSRIGEKINWVFVER